MNKILLSISLMMGLVFGACAQKASSPFEPLETGAIAPDFTLSSNTETEVALSKIEKPTVLVFYRGLES